MPIAKDSRSGKIWHASSEGIRDDGWKRGRKTSVDVIVLGAGHAGCEAAAATAKGGYRTLMLTSSLDEVAGMARGPLITEEGTGRGTGFADRPQQRRVIKETQLGGGVSSRGGRYWWVNAREYSLRMKCQLEGEKNLLLKQSLATSVGRRRGRFVVSTTLGEEYEAQAVIVAVGSHLGRRTQCGPKIVWGSEAGVTENDDLRRSLEKLGIVLDKARLDIGPRIASRKVENRFMNRREEGEIRRIRTRHNVEQTRTDGRHKGEVEGKSGEGVPRTAAMRFSGKARDGKRSQGETHGPEEVMLVPEDSGGLVLYVEGAPSGLSLMAQEQWIRSFRGLARVDIVEPGVTIDFHYVNQCSQRRLIDEMAQEGLFFAGRVCGAAGYYEAAVEGGKVARKAGAASRT